MWKNGVEIEMQKSAKYKGQYSTVNHATPPWAETMHGDIAHLSYCTTKGFHECEIRNNFGNISIISVLKLVLTFRAYSVFVCFKIF